MTPPYNSGMKLLLALALCSGFVVAQEQPAPPAAAPQQQTSDQQEQQEQKEAKPKPGFKDLKRHFSSWCVGAPVNRCYEKKEDADAAQKQTGAAKSQVPASEAPPRSDQQDVPASESSSKSSQIDLSPPP